MKSVVFDTETTGLMLPSCAPLASQPRIIELGVVVVEDGKIKSEHNWLVYPGQEISQEITKITGIKNSDLAGRPLFCQVLAEIRSVFAGSGFGFAHNAPFDTGMLVTELALAGEPGLGFQWPEEIVCTAQEFTPMIGKRPKLTELYEYVIGRKLEQTHRAIDDAVAVHEILSKLNYYEIIAK